MKATLRKTLLLTYPMKNTVLLSLTVCLSLTTAPLVSAADMISYDVTPSTWHKAPPRLPDLPLTTTQGTQTNARTVEGKVVLVLFQPDCDHCQREAEAIREHLDAFQEYTLYFVTYAEMADIKQFAQDYQLDDQSNIFFAFAEVQPIVDTFGSVPTPSLYIYSDEQQLVKAFEGETAIENVLEYL